MGSVTPPGILQISPGWIIFVTVNIEILKKHRNVILILAAKLPTTHALRDARGIDLLSLKSSDNCQNVSKSHPRKGFGKWLVDVIELFEPLTKPSEECWMHFA